ncbi:SIS domain-containing protein [Flavimaricola marinus]|uniref:Glutamine--fructose-6-phosphate aminotransferase [isomerizing] n=1 Tax=Flavimaricola marinus TaxID=1819565 RepID=A0A238LB74_9RHOB|nr:SIS domain-containing protein [Flavimaricola marinus]SMY06664.1 Glutamine--fructose-6-phosphate aminotransferase [isomerizing] [Flavimaricola marinus]
MNTTPPGSHMAREIGECIDVFCAAASVDHPAPMDLARTRAIYTIARGSSDAAANILSYELMRETGLPVTSLPPSVFSLGEGVTLTDAAALVISQSGASDDLVRAATGARGRGAQVVAITNQPGSSVEAAANVTLPISAGPELAVPATKTVVGSIAAGMALLAALLPGYKTRAASACTVMARLRGVALPQAGKVQSALLRAQHVYVIGRDTGYGAAHEVALKIKETCAIHAEAYSSSEVLHGPLQLATKPLTVLILDTGSAHIQDSLDAAEARFRAAGCDVHRMRPSDVTDGALTPAAAAALMLTLVYPVILATALALGHDPDAPATLSKVTQTT